MYDLTAKREMDRTMVITSETQLTGKSYTNTPSGKMNLINSALGVSECRVGVRGVWLTWELVCQRFNSLSCKQKRGRTCSPRALPSLSSLIMPLITFGYNFVSLKGAILGMCTVLGA